LKNTDTSEIGNEKKVFYTIIGPAGLLGKKKAV
jgi:hypothetical protein